MAIANPEQNTSYCEGTSGAVLEYQTPDRDKLQKDYVWGQYVATPDQVPIKYLNQDNVGVFVESVNIAPGNTITTASSLNKNKFYTFVAIGSVTLSGTLLYDACFRRDVTADTTTPADNLTTNDSLFATMFGDAARKETVTYDGINHQYSVGYIGNEAPITFTLPSGGTGLISIAIYENEYRLLIFSEDGSTIYFDETRNKPYLNINIACGGDCPSRTSFSCECSGDRSCYWDDGDGAISKVFEGSANP